MNETTQKTPIEVILAVDDEGYTTASAVYEWLELDPSHFARWCSTNIVENPMFEEGVDYIPIDFKPTENGFFAIVAKNAEVEETAENGVFDIMSKNAKGRPKTDYRITSDVAKMLCLMARNEKGKLAYRYFIKMEDALKQVMLKSMAEVKRQGELIQEFQTRLSEYEERQALLESRADQSETRIGVIETGTIAYRQSYWVDFIVKRIALLAEHYVDGRTNKNYTFKQMFHYILDELERKYPGYNDELREMEKIYEFNTKRTDGRQRPIQVIDYGRELRFKFNSFVNRELYSMGVIDEEEDRENDLAMLLNLYPQTPNY